ncbi:phosphodiesterase [Auraticoccus sp. F435]|uniref:Phosphodiesterase n=1 Tax=Auraticoccus cholistanensis TaxID=2656650 RepID=A0A6A9UW78_9ACTN|nr:metallophosphoesterase [Auraticoccus cholistanensis]MVA77176.1 phosphodiesterase [Auraticoccus cholistanensis]
MTTAVPTTTTEYPRPSVVLAHLTDLHITGDGSPLYGAVDSTRRLAAALDRLERSGVRPDALVLSGDLADRGEPAAYRTLRSLVWPVAERLGAEVVVACGNHDDRAALRQHLLDGAGEPGAPADAPVRSVHRFGGLRVLVVDSSVPGAHWGAVDEEQLGWLAAVLAEPAPLGTVLVVHHPPAPTLLDLALTVELRGQARLAEVLAGSDVRAVLAGHVHHTVSATFAGIPVHAASGLAYTQDLLAEGGGTRGQDGEQAFGLVHVLPGTVVHAVAPVTAHPTVGERVPAEEVARRLAAAGITRPA